MDAKDIADLRDSEFLSLSQLTERTGLAKSALVKLLAPFPASVEVRTKIQRAANLKSSSARAEAISSKLRIHTKAEKLVVELSSVQRGYAAEALFVYRAILAGLDVILPSRSMSACDVVVRTRTGAFRSVEVKGTCAKEVSFSRVSSFSGTRSSYSEEDKVDYFAGVDLESENVFVVPYEKLPGSRCSTREGTSLWQFVNRFDLIC